MAPPIGFAVWKWFAGNALAQGIAAALAIVVLWRMNNLVVGRSATARQRLREKEARLRALERARRTIQHETKEAADAADEALAKRNPGGAIVPGSLSDAQRRRIFGRQPADQ
jgi:hypothetical protein